ncbi:hypothetical protein [Streptomyces sp. NPDC058240]|uniref:hypothetical protein n=1 Tax=Streptomyces sp. NPDC058240 TaxID=3346396 RepID=UPI0036ED0F76
MIILARTMYSEAPDRNPAELLDAERFPDENSLEEHLLAGFVPTVYRRRVAERSATRRRERHRDPERAERWLGHLAHHLARLDGDQQDLAWWRIGDSLRLSASAPAHRACPAMIRRTGPGRAVRSQAFRARHSGASTDQISESCRSPRYR